MTDDSILRAAALESKAWPYEEARKLVTFSIAPVTQETCKNAPIRARATDHDRR